MKGSSGIVGARRMVALSDRLQTDTIQGIDGETRALLDQLCGAFEEAKAELTRIRESLAPQPAGQPEGRAGAAA